MAAPFGGVGLDDAEQARSRSSPGRRRRRAHSRRRRAARGAMAATCVHSASRPVGHQRLLDPDQRPKSASFGSIAAGGRARSQPWLTSTISRSPRRAFGDRPQRAEVGLLAEADLELEGAMALGAHALDRVEGGPAGIDARGIDRHRPIVAAAQRPPQRQAALAGAQVVDREVEAGRGGREGAGIAALDAQHVQRAVDLGPQRRPDRRATCRARAAPRCRRTAARDARRRRWGSCTRSRPSRARRRNPRPARTPRRARSWCRTRCGPAP